MKNLIKREQFNPRFIGIFTNPFYFSRRLLYLTIKKYGKELRGDLLDVGCGTKPYEELLEPISYTGMEIFDSPNKLFAHRLYDGKTFHADNGEFNSILCTEVLEHVGKAGSFLRECNRVLKMNGMLLISAPFVWDEHEQPKDYWRFTSFGFRGIIEQRGFKIEKQIKSGVGLVVIFQLINEYIYKLTYVQNPVVRLVLNILLISPFTIVGIILSAILPKNDDLYLDNVVLARKVRNV